MVRNANGYHQHARLNTCGKVSGDEYKPYENLANGIIKQAVRDWQDAFIDIHDGCKRSKCEQKIKEMAVYADDLPDGCESFFHSKWLEALTKVDGRYLLKLAKQQVIDNDYKKFWYNPRHN